MVHSWLLRKILGRNSVEIARTLFVAIVMLDAVLLGPWLVRLLRLGPKETLSWIADGGDEAIWGFSVVSLGLLLTTLLLWWTQAWLVSRDFAAVVRDEMVALVRQVLVEEYRWKQDVERYSQALYLQLEAALLQVEYRPLAKYLNRPVARMRGNVLVKYSLARAVASTFCKREIPDCPDRLERLPAEWLSDQPAWRAAPQQDRDMAEAATLELCPNP